MPPWIARMDRCLMITEIWLEPSAAALAAIPWRVFQESGGVHLFLAGLGCGAWILRRAPRLWPQFFIGFVACLAGYLNLLTDEIRLAARTSFTAALFAGFLRPAQSPRWVPWIALPVPVGEFLRHAWTQPMPNLTAILAACTVLFPVTLGVMLGRLGRRRSLKNPISSHVIARS